jgi:hypothetical protein
MQRHMETINRLKSAGKTLQKDVDILITLFDVYDTLPLRPNGILEVENWDDVDPMKPLGQPVGKRFVRTDYAGYIVGFDHRKEGGSYLFRYEDGDLLHFPARKLDTNRNYYVHIQNCAPPPERAQEHGNVLFAGFTLVPNTYAVTVDQAGDFIFLDQLSRENHLFQLRDNPLPTSVPARNTRCLIVNTTKLVLSLCPLFGQGSNERATLRQFVHFLPRLLHTVGLRHQDVESSRVLIAQGKWRQVWRMALARTVNLQTKREKNPSTARQRSATEKAKCAHKCATAGNVSKTCKIVCQEMIPACSDDQASQKFENIFAIAKRLVQQTSMTGAVASMFFICLRTMTRNCIISSSTISFSLMSWGNFSLFFCPNLRGAFCLRFSRKMAVFALFCVGQSVHRRQIDPHRRGRRPLHAVRLTSECTRDAAHTYFNTTYPNFMQCAGGLQVGATRCAQLINMLHDLPTDDQDPEDPVTFINTKAVFQEMCRQASFDTLTGKACRERVMI